MLIPFDVISAFLEIQWTLDTGFFNRNLSVLFKYYLKYINK